MEKPMGLGERRSKSGTISNPRRALRSSITRIEGGLFGSKLLDTERKSRRVNKILTYAELVINLNECRKIGNSGVGAAKEE